MYSLSNLADISARFAPTSVLLSAMLWYILPTLPQPVDSQPKILASIKGPHRNWRSKPSSDMLLMHFGSLLLLLAEYLDKGLMKRPWANLVCFGKYHREPYDVQDSQLNGLVAGPFESFWMEGLNKETNAKLLMIGFKPFWASPPFWLPSSDFNFERDIKCNLKIWELWIGWINQKFIF